MVMLSHIRYPSVFRVLPSLHRKAHAVLHWWIAWYCCMWPVLQFVLADASAEPDFQPAGVVIICGALLADAFVGNTQESLMAYVGVVSRYVCACSTCFRRTFGSLQWST